MTSSFSGAMSHGTRTVTIQGVPPTPETWPAGSPLLPFPLKVQTRSSAAGDTWVDVPATMSADGNSVSFPVTSPRAGVRMSVQVFAWDTERKWMAGSITVLTMPRPEYNVDPLLVRWVSDLDPVTSGGGGGLTGPQVQALIATALDAIDWDSFATDAEVLEAIAAVQGAVDELATEEWVVEQIAAAGVGTLTADQIAAIAAQVGDLSNYSTTEQVTAAIAAAIKSLGDEVSVALGQVIDDQSTQINALAEAVENEFNGLSFSDTKPIKISSPSVQQQSNGDPIGLGPDGSFWTPVIVGAIPVNVNGVDYLIPIIEK